MNNARWTETADGCTSVFDAMRAQAVLRAPQGATELGGPGCGYRSLGEAQTEPSWGARSARQVLWLPKRVERVASYYLRRSENIAQCFQLLEVAGLEFGIVVIPNELEASLPDQHVRVALS